MDLNNYKRSIPSRSAKLELHEVEVEMKPGSLFEMFCTQYQTNLKMFLNQDELPFTDEEFRLYLEVLLFNRIGHVNKERTAIRAKDFQVFMPCFVYFILAQIGRVEDRERMLVLYPKFAGEMKLSFEEQRELVAKIGTFLSTFAEKAGARCFPTNSEGDLGYMTLTVVENQVLAPDNKVEPCMPLAMAVIQNVRNTSYLTSNVRYGDVRTFRSEIYKITDPGLGDELR